MKNYQEKAIRTFKYVPKLDLCRTDSQTVDWLAEHIVEHGRTADRLKKKLIYKQENIDDTAIVMRMDGQEVTTLHMMLGVVGEVGELTEACLRYFGTKMMDHVKLKEEIGDLLWYLTNLCECYGFSISDAMGANIAKLEARYSQGVFSFEECENRDSEKEREAVASTVEEGKDETA